MSVNDCLRNCVIRRKRCSVLCPGDIGGRGTSGHTHEGMTIIALLVGEISDGGNHCIYVEEKRESLITQLHWLTIEARWIQSHIEGYDISIGIRNGAVVYSLV